MRELDRLESERRKIEKKLVVAANKLIREVRKPVRKTKDDYFGGPNPTTLKKIRDEINDLVKALDR